MFKNAWMSRVWFTLNAVLALCPPLYWAIGESDKNIIGLPVTLIYFLAICLSISCSIVYAYSCDLSNGEFES